MTRIEMPHLFPAYVETANGSFVPCDEATVAQWKEQKSIASNRSLVDRRVIARLVKIADVLGLPDETPLVPRIKAQGRANVVSLRPASNRKVSAKSSGPASA